MVSNALRSGGAGWCRRRDYSRFAPEEAGLMQQALHTHGLDLIMFVAPTPDARIAQIAAVASGFIYCVSLTGVTGARTSLWDGLPAFLARVRTQTVLPLVVGFGITYT
jgi:tryptophan synthase alpha chain